MKTEEIVLRVVILIAWVLSVLHVRRECRRDKRIGHPVLHPIMVAVALWPLGYIAWLLWWPGTLRKRLSGADQKRAEQMEAYRRAIDGNREEISEPEHGGTTQDSALGSTDP
jgi:hypothetical protein